MEGTTLKLPPTPGFCQLRPIETGSSLISYVEKPAVISEYVAGDVMKLTGLCRCAFISSASIIRGIVFISPKAQTVLTPTMIKIGPCVGPFTLNQNLQNLGILIYESPDSSLLIIPVNVSSPLLVEVDT